MRPRDGRLFVGDGQRQYVVMPFTLRVPAFSMAAQQAVIPLLDKARQAARKAVPQVEVVATGVILYAAAAGAQASRKCLPSAFGSILGIMVLMWVTFHSLKPIALIMLSIGVGCLGALSVCWLLFRAHPSADLSIRRQPDRRGPRLWDVFPLQSNRSGYAALDSWQLLRRLLPALVLTLVTTVIGYMGLALTPFPGLRQMAVFSALGLIFAWLTVSFGFPYCSRRRTLRAPEW